MPKKQAAVFLSGGIANTAINASLGGSVSTTEFSGGTLSFLASSIPGVTLIDAVGALEGSTGELYYQVNTLAVAKLDGNPPDVKDYLEILADGDYVLTNNEGDMSISITAILGSFPVGSAQEPLTYAKNAPSLFANIPSLESEQGSIKLRHVYLQNITAVTIQLKIFLQKNLNGMDTLSLGFISTSGAATAADESLASEDDLPSGVTFDSPPDVASAILLTVQPNHYLGMYIRRELPPLSDISTPFDEAAIIVEIVK